VADHRALPEEKSVTNNERSLVAAGDEQVRSCLLSAAPHRGGICR